MEMSKYGIYGGVNMRRRIDYKYGRCWYCICDNCSMIYNLYIEKEYRRNGKARKLLLESINNIRNSGYKGSIKIVAMPQEDSISKEDLIKLYSSLGLEVVSSDFMSHINE